MSPLRLSGSTSGFSQLDAPAIAGDQTFTLPSTGGTIDRLNRAGNVLQVVENSSSTTQSSSTTTYASLITASITPSSASNKILIYCSAPFSVVASTNAYAGIAIYRGTTSGTLLVQRSWGVNTGVLSDVSLTAFYLDSPATISSQTYTLAFRKGSLNTTSVNTDGGLYNIILLEVAA
jgi:hypothetical protein